MDTSALHRSCLFWSQSLLSTNPPVFLAPGLKLAQPALQQGSPSSWARLQGRPQREPDQHQLPNSVFNPGLPGALPIPPRLSSFFTIARATWTSNVIIVKTLWTKILIAKALKAEKFVRPSHIAYTCQHLSTNLTMKAAIRSTVCIAKATWVTSASAMLPE